MTRGGPFDQGEGKLWDPVEIEKRSFEIIEGLMSKEWPWPEKALVKRVIHATGDPEYAGLLEIHPEAIPAGQEALRRGGPIITDVKMVQAGLNRKNLEPYGCKISCFIDEPAIVNLAKESGKTRAALAMDWALQQLGERLADSVFVIGNAPTALFALLALLPEKDTRPALVIGTPVGFVGASEAKEALRSSGIPYIITRGVKGGSAVAVACFNAISGLSGPAWQPNNHER